MSIENWPAHVRAAENLRELFERMQEQSESSEDDWSDLPTFSGTDPREGDLATDETVWSWDHSHMIIGACQGELQIVERPAIRA